MTYLFGHEIERTVYPDSFDGSICYTCVDCGLQSNTVSEFEQYHCDKHRR